MPLRRNILLFHSGIALGDFVVAWPLALGLGRVFAQSRVFYMYHGAEGAAGQERRFALTGPMLKTAGITFFRSTRTPGAGIEAAGRGTVDYQLRERSGGSLGQECKGAGLDPILVTLATIPPEGFSGHVAGHRASTTQAVARA